MADQRSKAAKVCERCDGAGYVDAPSHSIERTQFGVGPIGVYVCPDCLGLLRLMVRTARDVEPREFAFERSRTAGSAAETVALACGYPLGEGATLAKDGFALPYERTLAAAGINSGDVLDLVIVGGAV